MRFFTTIYVLLLIYIVTALLFWGYNLHKQSEIIFDQQMLHLRTQMDSVRDAGLYAANIHDLEDRRSRRRKQYLGEGSTFLAVIFIGAAIVYSSFRRSIQLSRQQNNFMLSVTHELKSPIAAMKLNLQTLEKYSLDEEKKGLLIEKCIRESNRLNDLCNNILLASQMEGRQYKAVKEQVDMVEQVTAMMREYQLRYPARFDTSITVTEATIFADHLMVQMALSNLIENALKYSDQTIKISLYSSGRYVVFSVADTGPGIPDSEKSKIFRKFYRIGNEGTRKTKGTGLGLYLTSKIVHQHKGKILLKDNQPNGSVFELQFPLV